MKNKSMTSVPTFANVRLALATQASSEYARELLRFFKTGAGEYGEGDRFLGIRVPQLRAIAQTHRTMPMTDIMLILESPYHEERLLALLLMIDQYDKGDEATRQIIFSAYLDKTRWINNWDLVDLSAPHIVGRHLVCRDRSMLIKLACSQNLWERRIAMLAPFWFIKANDFRDALHIASMLVHDQHDLIHKAVGWMLREIGKRDLASEELFLKKHYAIMPRTMLRYAIERFPEDLRQAYLKGFKT